MRIAGCDCGKGLLTIAVIERFPTNVKKEARKHKPIVCKADQEGLTKLLSLDADIYALEPTGNYSKLWINSLKSAGREIRLVNPNRVKNLMKMYGIANKSDRLDCYAIGVYTLLNLNCDEEFIGESETQMRELIHDRNRLVKATARLKNQIGNRLTYEVPELVKSWEGGDRDWREKPGGIFLDVAGMPPNHGDKWQKRRQARMDSSIGCGLSSHTRGLAMQLIQGWNQAQAIEATLAVELERPEYRAYRRIFERFKLYPSIEAVLLSHIYPFEKFLGANGRRIIEYTPTKRDRSEGGFKLSCGMGKVLHQSGDIEEWKAGGSKLCRTAIWQFTKTVIVIPRYPGKDKTVYEKLAQTYNVRASEKPWLNEKLVESVAIATSTTPEIASLRLHFEFAPEGKKGDRRTSATAGRFTRMLYKKLLNKFQQPTSS